jgi:hypothetical protein
MQKRAPEGEGAVSGRIGTVRTPTLGPPLSVVNLDGDRWWIDVGYGRGASPWRADPMPGEASAATRGQPSRNTTPSDRRRPAAPSCRQQRPPGRVRPCRVRDPPVQHRGARDPSRGGNRRAKRLQRRHHAATSGEQRERSREASIARHAALTRPVTRTARPPRSVSCGCDGDEDAEDQDERQQKSSRRRSTGSPPQFPPPLRTSVSHRARRRLFSLAATPRSAGRRSAMRRR